MDGDGALAEDCPNLLCEEVDLEISNDQRRMRRKRRREEEEEVFNQREDEEAGEEAAREEKEGEEQTVSEREAVVAQGEEEQVKPEGTLEVEEVQTEDNKKENSKETILDIQQNKETKSVEEKDEQKKSRKRRGKKQSDRVRNRRAVKEVNERPEEEERSQVQDAAVSSEDSLALTEPSLGMMNGCDLSDPIYLGCGGAGVYCPQVPIPLLYSSQSSVPVQPAAPQPHGTKRLQSLPQQGPRPLEMEVTQVYSTRRSIRYSSRGRCRALSFPLGLEAVDGGLMPPAPKKKTRTLYSTDQLEHLEALFHEDHYPDAEKRKIIAASVGVTPQRIMVWFQNRRAKWRKVERSIAEKVEHAQSRTGCSISPLHHQMNPTLVPNSMGVASFSGHLAAKLPQLTPAVPSFPTLSSQMPSSYNLPLASFDSPSHHLSSQGELTEYHPRPMHSPPPLRRASFPFLTTTYNPPNPTLLNTPAHTPPLFLGAVEGSSTTAHHDTPSLQTDTSSLFDFGDKLDYLTSSQPNNMHSYQLQTSYPNSQPQHQSQMSLPRMTFLTPSPYLTPSPSDSSLASYLSFGPGGNSTGVETYSTGGHAYFQSQSAGQILLVIMVSHFDQM
uniref:homeobox protein Hox-A3a n=1 Tax=Monopterus albus TaxID=43700 RepID=UPI0009B35DE9|nr:homeobox protein NOBOX [Monopterus albus]